MTSTTAFGLGAARVAAFTDHEMASIGMLAAMAAYGMFWWTLLTAFTLPVFLVPVLLWIALARIARSMLTRP